MVCGERHFSTFKSIKKVLDALGRDIVIIHGDGEGTDQIAGKWARLRGICEIRVPAQWTFYGSMADMLRNEWIMAHLQPDLVITFGGDRGTIHMVALAKVLGIPVERVRAWDVDHDPGRPCARDPDED